jgi:plasmid maintenance system antidote protein VapI
MTDSDRLIELIDTKFGGSQAAFARAIKRQPAQVNQYVKGRRMLGVEVMIHIEYMLGVPGWFNINRADLAFNENCDLSNSETRQNISKLPTPTLETLVEHLSQYLAKVPLADRASSSAALAALSQNPDSHAQRAAMLRLLINAPNPTQETKTGT